LIKDYDLEIHYHPGKANVVADSSSRKASCHCLTVIQRIIDAQRIDKGMKYIHEKMEADKANCFRKDDQGVIRLKDRIVVPKDAELRQQILDEAHLSRYSIHPGSTKMYQDLKQQYWWTTMKIKIARYVAKCDTCRRVKAVHMKTTGPLQSLPIPT
jgi:hypothetical protein